MNEPIVLREYDRLVYDDQTKHRHKSVTKQEWDEVRDYILNNPAQDGNHVMEIRNKTIRAMNYVGVLKTSKGTTIEILPKIDLDQDESSDREKGIFLQMLRRWKDGPCRHFSNADVRTIKNFPLWEAFIAMFLKDLLALTRRGLACSYNEVEENSPFLKGKLLITGQLRHNLIRRERFYVQYQEFSTNRPINRLIKSTVLLLQRRSKSESNLAQIRQALLYFDEVPASANIDSDLARARVDRTMPLYNRLFQWVRMFLKSTAPATWHERTPAIALLFPMERIFEDYVAHLLRRAPDWEVTTQERRCYLVEKNPHDKPEFQLRPDIVARHGSGPEREVRIMDTKWKQLDSNKDHHSISQSDLYQLYAYGRKYQSREGSTPTLYLLYPYNDNFTKPRHFTYEDDLRLEIWPVNIDEETRRENSNERPKVVEDLLPLATPQGAGSVA